MRLLSWGLVSDERDRRGAERHELYFAAEILPEGGARGRAAITHDASESGALVLTRAHLEVGQRLELRVLLPGEAENPRTIAATVVRREALSPAEVDFWKEKVAVRFDDPDPTLVQDMLVAAMRHEP
jgi:hypothetical protein